MKNVVSDLQGTLFESPIFLSWHYGYNRAITKSIEVIENYKQSEPTQLIMKILSLRYETESKYHTKVPRTFCRWSSKLDKYEEVYNPKCSISTGMYGGAYYGFIITLKTLANYGYFATVIQDGELVQTVFK